MQRTLSLLSPLATPEILALSLEEISDQYKATLNPSLLAGAFKKTFNLIINLSNHYYGLTQDDISSFSLEKLDMCLRTFDDGQAKFVTYFSNVLKNKFREETESLNTQKRKSIFNSDSYESIVEGGYDLPSESIEIEQVDLFMCLEEYDLSERELSYCKLLASDFTNTEITSILGISAMGLSKMRKRLRTKLLPIVV